MSATTMITARNTTRVVALAALLGSLAPAALAQEGGPYVGLQAGKSFIDTNEDIFDLDDDTGFQGFVGWKFTDWLGVEAAYTDMGDFEGEYYDDTGANDFTLNIEAVTIGLSLWGNFGWGIDVFAKLGGAYATTTAEDTGGDDYDESDFALFYEAGLLYPFNDMIGATLSWQNFHQIEILDAGTDAGVDMIKLGVIAQF